MKRGGEEDNLEEVRAAVKTDRHIKTLSPFSLGVSLKPLVKSISESIVLF